MKITKHTTTN